MEQKEILNNYFEYNWKPNYNNRQLSGYSLMRKLNTGQDILDIGCGYGRIGRPLAFAAKAHCASQMAGRFAG